MRKEDVTRFINWVSATDERIELWRKEKEMIDRGEMPSIGEAIKARFKIEATVTKRMLGLGGEPPSGSDEDTR